ncbi:S-adenosylmethionine:tRNA ribosyltransferase-isomerase [compost metagenome]
MKLSDLDFSYPESLVATEPRSPSRVMKVVGSVPNEITFAELVASIPAGDVLVLNNTKVLKRRVFSNDLEILFLKQISDLEWEVLFPSKKFKLGESIPLPEGESMFLTQKGRPQRVQVSTVLTETYFQRNGELPLPPYIQKARQARHTVDADESWYQTVFAKKEGSFAAPTASLHFKEKDLESLRARGVKIVELTLHVGLGTFLPVTAEDLDQHDMHEEYVEIPHETWSEIQKAKKQGHRVWTLGTTATRSVESAAKGLLKVSDSGDFSGFTKLLIQPGYQWAVCDVLMTNFHQPQSTLLALVSGFSSLETVKACYQWAIERNFRLFSYGDLSVWER